VTYVYDDVTYVYDDVTYVYDEYLSFQTHLVGVRESASPAVMHVGFTLWGLGLGFGTEGLGSRV
jgi:hypothetical protein